MGSVQVLVATEFQSYREAIAHVMKSMRPDVEVRAIDPGTLESELSCVRAGFVICSHATPFVESSVPVWVELHPDDGPDSRVGIRGETRIVEDMQLEDLLELLELTVGIEDSSLNGTSLPKNN